MSEIIEVRMPAPEGVGAGQTATFKLPIGRQYHGLRLKYTGVTLAQMTEIRVIANQKVIHRYSGAERDSMNQFDGRTAAAGFLAIPFDRYKLKDRLGEQATALNTGSFDQNGRGITSLSIEIDIDGAATAPVLELTASQSERAEGGAGTIVHVTKHTRSAAGAGEFEISDLPYGRQTSAALSRVFFKPSANDIDKIIIDRDLYTVWERSKALNEAMQNDGVRKPQSGWIAVDKTENQYAGSPINLVGAKDFRYRLTMTGAASITVLSEYMGALGD